MKDAIEFRRQAEECRQLAAIEADDEDKAYCRVVHDVRRRDGPEADMNAVTR